MSFAAGRAEQTMPPQAKMEAIFAEVCATLLIAQCHCIASYEDAV
jgi:hypothetical protein